MRIMFGYLVGLFRAHLLCLSQVVFAWVVLLALVAGGEVARPPPSFHHLLLLLLLLFRSPTLTSRGFVPLSVIAHKDFS